jgi:peptidoglycan/LPS O-acetylase OafA/YrhL
VAPQRPAMRADIQGLRGLAVLLVVGFHVRGWVPGGFIGVDVFFVVSGFVITSLLQSQLRADGSIRVGSFFARRVRRLLPMLAITLGVTSLLGVALLSPLGASAVTARTGIAAALFNANTFLSRQSDDYFALAPEANALLHTWSLSVEEQFYLVVPLVVALWVVLRRRMGRPVAVRAGAVLLAGAGVGSLVLFVVASRGGLVQVIDALSISSPQALAFYGAPLRAWEFLVGATLALAAPRVARWPRPVRTASGAVGLVAILAAAALSSGENGSLGPSMLVPVLGAAALLAAGTGGSTIVAALMSHPVLVAIGGVSYGWYLFHWPLIVFAEANLGATWSVVLAAVASLGLALVAKRVVEDRFRYDDRWVGRRVVLLAAACIVVPVLAGGVAVVADRALAIDELEATSLRHMDSNECNRRFGEPVPIADPVCTWSVPDAGGHVVLIGDSHASMWSEPVAAAGNELGLDVSIATMSGCPMVGATVRFHNGEEDHDCQAFIDRSVAEIVALQPEVVLVGTGSTGGLAPAPDEAWSDADGRWVGDPAGVAEIWERGLGDTLDRLADAGVPTVLLHDVPYHDVTTATCGRLLFMVSPSSCGSTMTLGEVEAQQARSSALEDRLDERSELVSTVDPVPWLCPVGECSTYLDGTWMYRDGDHLSVAGASALTGEVRDVLLEHAR